MVRRSGITGAERPFQSQKAHLGNNPGWAFFLSKFKKFLDLCLIKELRFNHQVWIIIGGGVSVSDIIIFTKFLNIPLIIKNSG